MKNCPNCGAPNPARLTTCFSCGHNLKAAGSAAASIQPGLPVHHCSNCHAILSTSASECPNCGRVPDADASPAYTFEPAYAPPAKTRGPQPLDTMTLPGWGIERLPDGAMRLRRSVWQRLNNDAVLPAICVVFGILLMRPGGSRLPESPGAMGVLNSIHFFYVIGALVAITGLALAVWQLAAAEEIRLGLGFFERTKTLGPVVLRKRFDVIATIRGQTRQTRDRNGRYAARTLILENLSQRLNLDQRIRRESFFGLGVPTPAADDEIATLGRFIADITGWQFTDDLPATR